jgi:pimeloyl-ACP methyl ester carboxylesterase
MQESEVKIKLPESNLYIYGTLRGDFEHPLIVMCHGYSGWMHEMLSYNGARFFEKKGYSTLRLSMYGGGENSRDIANSDVITHAKDIDTVVKYLRNQGVEWIGVVGHSYSGMGIIYTEQQDFDSAVLWDPTHTDGYNEGGAIQKFKESFSYINELGIYVSGKGGGNVYAKAVFDNEYPKSPEMAKKFNIPTLVINASWSQDQQKYVRNYAENINAEASQITIPDSTHPFTGNGIAEILFEITADYFDNQRQK